MEYSRPVLLVSTCLGFEGCDFHGQKHKCSLVEDLKPYADLKIVCPESGMGLPAPRASLRIIQAGNELRLVQPETGKDFTEILSAFSSRFLDSMKILDGCILKKRSPTCGIRDVKVYKDLKEDIPVTKGKGLFSAEVEKRFPDILIEDEGRLTSHRIRDHFLTAVFTKADFRRVVSLENISELHAFHDRNRFLLAAYSKTRLNEMEKLLKQKGLSFEAVVSHYGILLDSCLKRIPRTASHKGVLHAAFSIFAPRLGQPEVDFFYHLLSLFESDRLPLSVIQVLLQSYALRFSEASLMGQTYFSPYPESLKTIRDSKK